nr:unnamed protein product [Callosobruchus analis]
MSKLISLMVLTYLFSLVYGRPTEGEVEAGGEAKVSPEDLLPKVFQYDNGTIGVSLLGFKASVGLGAFITGNLSDGWPHAEFETPFGQRAGSGLGPASDKSGKHTGFGYSFLEDVLQRVAPVAATSPYPSQSNTRQSSQEHNGHHKNHRGSHVHRTKGHDVATPTVKEMEEFRSIGDRKLHDNEIPKLITFENGGIGVNFLGFKARAGLGGLLTGNAADGGLFAEAGTPFGQNARAGLGGNVGSGLYADATAGGGVSAGAGLAGHTGPEGMYGKSYAGASAGNTIYKEKVVSSQPGAQVHIEEAVAGPVEKHAELRPVAEKHVEVSTGPVVEKEVTKEEKHHKTYIERTVVPNYQEKTVYVPSYVEKTIRVPTVVAQKVKVPVAPTVIEKTVDSPPENSDSDASYLGGGYGGDNEGSYENTGALYAGPFGSADGGGYARAGAAAEGGAQSGGGYTSSVNIRKTANPQLINDIFNIPISTLGAVNKLVSGIASGTSGSVSIQKTASVSKSVDA